MQPCGNRKLGLSARVFQVHCREGKKRISILAGIWLGLETLQFYSHCFFLMSHCTVGGTGETAQLPLHRTGAEHRGLVLVFQP